MSPDCEASLTDLLTDFLHYAHLHGVEIDLIVSLNQDGTWTVKERPEVSLAKGVTDSLVRKPKRKKD